MQVQVFASKEKKPDIVSKLIMEKLGCDYSHVGVICRGVIYHAIGKGVCKEAPSDFLKDREFVHVIDVTSRMKISADGAQAW